MKTPLITDEQTLVSASSRFGNPIPTYDDGYGSLYIHRDSMGITGIVRASSWEDAYSICEDEFFPAADEEATETPWEEMTDHEQACWEEAYGYRGNARMEDDGTLSSIYAKDLNGDRLDKLTPEMIATLEITLEIADPEIKEEPPAFFSWHESRRFNPNGRSVYCMQGKWGTFAKITAQSYCRRIKGPVHSHFSPGCDNHAVAW